MKQKHRAVSLFALLVLSLISWVGCARPPSNLPAPTASFREFSDSGTRTPPDLWWTAFGDKGLDEQVDRALRHNFTLATAWQRLMAAQAVVDRNASSLYPEVAAFGEAESGGRRSEDGQRLRLGLAPSYEVDLWGRIQAQVDAERYRAEASRADYQTAVLSVSGEVARTWYRLMEARGQLELIEDQIETNRKVLRLIENRFGIGQSRSVDILRQRQLVESSLAQRISVDSAIGVLEHRLAVLEGRQPQDGLQYESHPLPDLPPLPETGLPASLVRRRPDVQRTFRQLQAADKDLAAAITRRYPRLSFTGSVFTSEDDASDLFVDWAHFLAASLTAPLFDGGQRKAEIDRTEAVKQQRFFEYRQAVLTAFQEVENALIRETKQKQRVESIEAQIGLAGRAYDRLQAEYFNGIGAYIDVLLALVENQRLRRTLLAERRRLLEFRIDLYLALAGGFYPDREKNK